MCSNRQTTDGQGPDSRCDIGRGLAFGGGAVKHLDLLALAGGPREGDGGVDGGAVLRNFIALGVFGLGDRRRHHLEGLDRVSAYGKNHGLVLIRALVECRFTLDGQGTAIFQGSKDGGSEAAILKAIVDPLLRDS
ncbi:hypothetical protein D3C78_1225740 [compost metagenome]